MFTEQLTKKLVCFGSENIWRNILLVSHGRNRQTIGQKHSMNTKKTTRQNTSASWRIFGVLNNPLSPNLADKLAIEDELTFDGGKNILACF